MAVPWTELGVIFFMTSTLWMASQSPVPLVAPADAEAHEGRTVRVAGFVRDVEMGADGHRGVLVAQGHAVQFQSDGTTAPQEGDWIELRGTLDRVHGQLTLFVHTESWISP